MARQHQEMIYLNGFSYEDDIKPAKIEKPFIESMDFEKYNNILETRFAPEIIFDMKVIKSLKINSFKYMHGLLIQINSRFLEIDTIVRCSNEYYVLSCISYGVSCYEKFTNSLVIKEKREDLQLINVSGLKSKKLYNKILLNHEIHVIVDTLEIYHMGKME